MVSTLCGCMCKLNWNLASNAYFHRSCPCALMFQKFCLYLRPCLCSEVSEPCMVLRSDDLNDYMHVLANYMLFGHWPRLPEHAPKIARTCWSAYTVCYDLNDYMQFSLHDLNDYMHEQLVIVIRPRLNCGLQIYYSQPFLCQLPTFPCFNMTEGRSMT
jgi:hypothetical protein